MKVKIIKGVACNPWNMSNLIGDILEIDNKQGAELIEAGRAELVKEDNSEIIEEAKPKKKAK
jgi:hypothetical protein